MTKPIKAPNDKVDTPYGKRGKHWSCNEDSNGNGIHTGDDFACPEGTAVYAPIAGRIRHRNYGRAFGSHQFAISPGPGQPFEDGEVFFAHMSTRPEDGIYVEIGDYLGKVSDEGNATGPHLHFEFMPKTKGVWKCGIHADPQKIYDHGLEDGRPSGTPQFPAGTVYLSRLAFGRGYKDSDSIRRLQDSLNRISLEGGQTLPITGEYDEQTDQEVRLHQDQFSPPAAARWKSFVRPRQAALLFPSSQGYMVVDDRDDPADNRP